METYGAERMPLCAEGDWMCTVALAAVTIAIHGSVIVGLGWWVWRCLVEIGRR